MAGAMMAKLLPIVLVSPIAGVVVDRVSRKTVMIISDLLRCGVVLGFLLVEDQNTLWLVYALVIVEISLSGFFEPARSAIIPSLVPKKDLVTANALSGSTWSVMLAFGAALGGCSRPCIRDKNGLYIGRQHLSAFGLVHFKNPNPENIHLQKGSPKQTGYQEFLDSLRYLWSEPLVLVLSLLKAGLAGRRRHHDPDPLNGQSGAVRLSFIGNRHPLLLTWIGSCPGPSVGQADFWRKCLGFTMGHCRRIFPESSFIFIHRPLSQHLDAFSRCRPCNPVRFHHLGFQFSLDSPLCPRQLSRKSFQL